MEKKLSFARKRHELIKDDALWAYHIWNDPEMGKYLPDEAKEDIDEE